MDDASEWEGMDEYLKSLKDGPITVESLLEYLDSHDVPREVPVEELLRRMREARS